MKYHVFFNFGVMPEPYPQAEGYSTREEAQAFIDAQANPKLYHIVETSGAV